MSEPRDSQSSTPDLDDEVDGLLESLTGDDGAPDAFEELEFDRHSAKTEPPEGSHSGPVPTPAMPAMPAPRVPAPAVTAPAPQGVTAPAPPRPAVPRIGRPASMQTMKGKWPSMSPAPAPVERVEAARDAMPTVMNDAATPAPPPPAQAPRTPVAAPLPPATKAALPRVAPGFPSSRLKPPTGIEDDEIEAALMDLGDIRAGTVPKAPPLPAVPEYSDDPPTVLADSTGPRATADSFRPPMMDSAESLDDLDAVELGETSNPEATAGIKESVPPPLDESAFDSDAPPHRAPSPTLDVDDDEEDEDEDDLFTADGPSVQATESLFEEWEEESVTTIHPPPNDSRTTEDSTVEFAATTLEDLGVDDRALASEPPPPIAIRPSVRSTLSDLAQDPQQARPAAAHLGDSRLIDAWVARAEWFEEEAQGTSDAHAKARLFLASSELWAMAGNVPRARDMARRSAEAAPSLSLGSRQARALDALDGDFKAVVTALDAESKTASTDVARAHAAYLASEVHRLVLNEPEQAERKLDVVMRTLPQDPRPYVKRVASELGADGGAPKTKIPEGEQLAPLAAAVGLLSALRGGPRKDEPLAPLVSFEDARHALAIGDRDGAGTSLLRLADVPGIGDSALRLAAALLAPSAETRNLAIAALTKLDERSPDPAARRALAARALEQGDVQAMSRALAAETEASSAFGPEDKVALGALSGGDPSVLAESALAVIEHEELRPLAAAAMGASAVSAHLPIGNPEMRARTALGRRLSSVATEEELKDAVHALRAAAPDAPLGRILSLELDAGAGATSAVAAELSRLAPSDSANGKLAPALIEEAVGHFDASRRHYTAALGSPEVAEAAGRALLAEGDTNVAGLLSTLSAALGEENTARQSLLLFEAAVHEGAGESGEDLLGRAHAAAPELPFAPRLGADRALAAGDVPKLVDWLRKRQKSAREPVLRALEGVREALLVADEDPAAALERVTEALAIRPEDVALHELAERLGPYGEGRARARERLGERLESPRAKSRLLFEAAAEFARSGARDDALRAARAAAAAGGSELARVVAQRLGKEPLAESPGPLASLRAQEHVALAEQSDEALVSVARRLAYLKDAGEAAAHARIAARLRAAVEPWDALAGLVAQAASFSPKSLWALRERSAHARISKDDAAILESERELMERSPRPVDAATLALRAAEAALRLGRKDEAVALVSRTIQTVPDHIVARSFRASLTEEKHPADAAADYEALARASEISTHQWDAWYRAAVLRLDRVKDAAGGLAALEHAAAIDVSRADVFDRLQRAYIEAGERQKLATLLERRLESTHDPEERIALEVTRGKALSDIGDRESARRALTAALEANPDHADALETFAGLAAADGDAQGAEQALIRLARIATDPDRQAAIYGKLGKLYDGPLQNPQRAEICYREILKRKPEDADAMQALSFVYVKLGDAAKALELATQLVDKAQSNEEKRDRTIALSRIYEDAGKDRKSAIGILDKARKTWPHDSVVLRAVAELHGRHGETAAQSVLLDRASAEARRALSHGRYEVSFFGILETVASLRGNADAAAVAGATLSALEGGEPENVRGAGASAAEPVLDDLLAPELLSQSLRALLKKLPGVLDAAYPVDAKALRAGPLPPSAAELAQEIRLVAESVGVQALELLVSPTLGPVFVPVSSSPAKLVIGQALLDSTDEAGRYFALFRALKMMQSHTSALSRIAPIELWPAMAGLLSALAPSFVPQGVDAAKVAEAKRKVQAALPSNLDGDLATLALDIAGVLGNRGSQLGQATAQWGSRAALLAVGSPHVALRGVALSLGQASVPPEGEGRIKWILRHPEARDVTVFSVSDAYTEARKRLGLAG